MTAGGRVRRRPDDAVVCAHALREMVAEHGVGSVLMVLGSVERRHGRGHDPVLDAAAVALLERILVRVMTEQRIETEQRTELDEDAP